MINFTNLFTIQVVFILVFGSIILSSCSKETSKTNLDYQASLKTLKLENFSENVNQMLEETLEDFSMELLCSCDCQSLQPVQSVLEEHGHILSIENAKFDYSCDQYVGYFKNYCSYENPEDYKDYVFEFLNQHEEFQLIMSKNEIRLVEDLIESVMSEKFSYSSYIKLWNSLPDSPAANTVSLVMIEMAKFASSSDIFSNDISDIQIFCKLKGAVIGAVVTPIVVAGYDLVVNSPGTYEFTDADDLKGAIITGAIGGFIAGG